LAGQQTRCVAILARSMLRPTRIAETVLYVDDLDRAVSFYIGLFGIPVLRRDDHFCALGIAEEEVLLLFKRGASLQPSHVEGGMIPAHDGSGPLHVAFGIARSSVSGWEDQLAEKGIAVESRVRWPGGPVSLYFRDPDGHVVELVTPGLWKTALGRNGVI
jgi:catechol 2,3-dioxygenase-like lactoylglutathione lyase family enzyme